METVDSACWHSRRHACIQQYVAASQMHPQAGSPAAKGKGGGATVGGSWAEPAALRYSLSLRTATPPLGSPAHRATHMPPAHQSAVSNRQRCSQAGQGW